MVSSSLHFQFLVYLLQITQVTTNWAFFCYLLHVSIVRCCCDLQRRRSFNNVSKSLHVSSKSSTWEASMTCFLVLQIPFSTPNFWQDFALFLLVFSVGLCCLELCFHFIMASTQSDFFTLLTKALVLCDRFCIQPHAGYHSKPQLTVTVCRS